MRYCTFLLLFVLLLLLVACSPQPPPDDSGLRAVTAVPTLDTTNSTVLCNAIDANWGRDWPLVIRALQALEVLSTDCGTDIAERLYIAHIAYGTLLEQRGRPSEAIRAYNDALVYNLSGGEAIRRLQQLNAFTSEPPAACDADTISGLLATLPDYTATQGQFVTITEDSFRLSGAVYPVYGVNYYPRDYPGKRFLTQMNVDDVAFEMEIMRAAGLNTLRIYLRHDDLFTCPGNGAIPIPVNFARLDAFIQLAAQWGFKLILVMNYESDLLYYPLYTSPVHTMAQMQFIAARYADEPTVMAYDLRPDGELDYIDLFPRTQVLGWLADAAVLVRDAAPDQLITAGWGDESEVTAPLVDFVSFGHFGNMDALRQEIAILKSATRKPILLAAIGYNTYDLDEIGQRQAYQRAFEAVAQNRLAGWVVWTAFDYPLNVLCDEPDCSVQDSAFNRYGIWNTSYFPKRALDAIENITLP